MLEKKLTIAVVVGVVLESAGLLVWAGAAFERLNEVEVKVSEQAEMAERLARVEVHVQNASAQLDRIEAKLLARDD